MKSRCHCRNNGRREQRNQTCRYLLLYQKLCLDGAEASMCGEDLEENGRNWGARENAPSSVHFLETSWHPNTPTLKKCKEKKNFWEIVIKIFLSETKFFFLETFLYRLACFLVLSNYKFGVSSEGIDSIIIYILQTGLLLVPWAYNTFSFPSMFFFFCYSQIERVCLLYFYNTLYF